jgi:SAM-dependent methyltransferase
MPKKLLTLFHDIEQDTDVPANPDACLEATRGMLALEREFGVSCTYNVVGRLMGQQPDLVRLIRDAGHEIAFHSFRHEPDWGPKRFLDNVRACRNADGDIKGYRSPRSQWNDDVLTELWRLGFLWSAESDTSPQPYFIHKGLVRLPIAIDDWGLHTGKLSEVDWLGRVQHHHAQRTCFGVGTHDCVFAQDPDRYLALYRRLLCWIRDQGIETATFGEVADLYRRSAIADYYDRRFPSWNSGVGALYRTGRFKDLITAKIQELHSPVVADLGSAGGALSRHLESAATVYCVDMVPGMIKDIAADNVRAVVGDVTASTLADNSIDFVIAARVIEYLYEPELMLDEVRRISRKGAGFFFSFPALTAKPPSNEGCAPDRVRRHYSKEEVESLGQRLGPGRVFGVHYLGGQEPRSPDEKQRLLDLETRQPEDMQPLDWVYIGRVENTTPARPTHRTLDLTDFAFEIPRGKLGIADRMKRLLARVRAHLAA